MTRTELDETPLWRTMLTFLLPLLLSNVLQSLSGNITAIYLGRMVGVAALAAVSAVFPVLFFLISFLIGLSSAATVLVGQTWGARDMARLKAVTGTTLLFVALLGIVAGILGGIFTEHVLVLLYTPPDIMDQALAYARITFYALPILFVFIASTTLLRGTGDSTTPFLALILATFISLIVTPLLIKGWVGLPPMGVTAGAWATIVAYAVTLVWLVFYLRFRRSPMAPDLALARALRINWPILKTLLRLGIFTGLQLVMVSLSEIAVIAFVNAFGSRATAAYGAVNQIASYVQFPAVSIGIAASVFGAQAIGAKRPDRLGPIMRTAITLSWTFGTVLIVLVYVFARTILGLFTDDAATIDVAHKLLAITLWSYVIFGTSVVIQGIMRSSGAVVWPTTLSVLAIWGIEVPTAYFLSQRYGYGIDGVWIAYPVAFICGLSFQLIYYFVFWRNRRFKTLV
jgi:putative MATE family efflux protein